MARLIDIEGIGSFHVGNLEAVGISTQEQLLTAAATPAGRQGYNRRRNKNPSPVVRADRLT